MNCAGYFLLIYLAAISIFGAVIEGTVPLPAPPAAISAAKYNVKTSAAVAPPEPPMAAIYLEGHFPANTNASTTVQMAQKGYQFSPGLLVVQTGTTVEFPNKDDDYHNVFSYAKTKRFDLGRYKKEEKPAAQKFEKPGVIKLYCEIHEHMRGTILIVDSPYFTKSKPDGTFRLENLPPGKYELKAWIDEKKIYSKPIELKGDETVQVQFP